MESKFITKTVIGLIIELVIYKFWREKNTKEYTIDQFQEFATMRKELNSIDTRWSIQTLQSRTDAAMGLRIALRHARRAMATIPRAKKQVEKWTHRRGSPPSGTASPGRTAQKRSPKESRSRAAEARRASIHWNASQPYKAKVSRNPCRRSDGCRQQLRPLLLAALTLTSLSHWRKLYPAFNWKGSTSPAEALQAIFPHLLLNTHTTRFLLSVVGFCKPVSGFNNLFVFACWKM